MGKESVVYVYGKYKNLIPELEHFLPVRKLKKREGAREFEGRSAVVSFPIKGETFRLLVKHYIHGGFFRLIKWDRFLKKKHKGIHAIKKYDEIAGRGIAVPEVIGAAMFRKGLTYRARLFMKEVENSERMKDYLLSKNHTAEQKDEMMKTAGEKVRDMHDKGVMHRDPSPENFLIAKEKKAARIYFIDLEHAKINDRVEKNGRQWDLDIFTRNFLRQMRIPKGEKINYLSRFYEGYGWQETE